jgi:hypothetical protein
MQVASDVLNRTAWLFTREQESIYVQLERRDGGWRLSVHGPAEACKTYDFSDGDALVSFHESVERHLLTAGFRLQAVAERRSGVDRRRDRRAGTKDRRRRP